MWGGQGWAMLPVDTVFGKKQGVDWILSSGEACRLALAQAEFQNLPEKKQQASEVPALRASGPQSTHGLGSACVVQRQGWCLASQPPSPIPGT